jgi:predicted enzyme related to lactoylglutathione lyase
MPSMNTIVYAVTDLEAAKAAFTALLGDPHTDQPYYVGFTVSGVEVGLDPNGSRKGLAGPLPYWTVDDITASRDALVGAGATVVQEPTEVGGGRRTAVVALPDGSHVGILQDSVA